MKAPYNNFTTSNVTMRLIGTKVFIKMKYCPKLFTAILAGVLEIFKLGFCNRITGCYSSSEYLLLAIKNPERKPIMRQHKA